MKFYTYITRNYLEEDSPFGDLARDMKNDKEFPRKGSLEQIRRYLGANCACYEALETFYEASKEFASKYPKDAQSIQCLHCGEEINLDWEYCPWCGEEI